MHSVLLLLLPLLTGALPTPEFAGIGPWEGEFFGRDPGQNYHYGHPSHMQGSYAPPYLGSGPPETLLAPEPTPPPPPPPLEPIDLMMAPKDQLPKLVAPPPPPPPPSAPDQNASTDRSPGAAGATEFDFMGGRWGIAGQGKYIDAARGEHKIPDRDGRRRELGQDKKQGGDDDEEVKERKELPPVEVVHDPAHPLKYGVNFGGIKTAEEDASGPTGFHVFTDEGERKFSSNDMNPETEKYIQEKMMPKLSGGKRRKGGNGGGNIFSVFGDGN